ncbi:chitotriosidase-1-like [Cylas formicarius]|uniref:chitotriosidase-1-like n=1 Tax=Cylas formicarius TaxID=197179 RepID=UPI0029585B90|nr:chitotriosidase-1-like [Cylas formicarius]
MIHAMKCHNTVSLCFLIALLSLVSYSEGKNIFCYFESWTVYRPGNGKYDVDNIDPNLCTHIAFTFIGLNYDGTISILDPWESNNDGLNGFGKFVALKEQNSNLKALVSIGGWNEGSQKYSELTANPSKRAIFVKSALQFLEEHEFDGLDFDWEYPARRDSSNAKDKENFILLLQELKTAFEPKGYLLSAAVTGAARYIDISYDVQELSKVLDYINVMSYDFHGSFDSYVGHHTPLYASHLDAEHDNLDWNIAAGIEGWIERGMDISKINLGIATYARTFTLEDPSNTSLYAAIRDGGIAGPYTRQAGILGYNEICELYSEWPRYWDDEQKVPHKVSGNQWIGYEDEFSISEKVTYALDKNLGGFMIWSFDTDDFLGLCGNGTYPLIKSVLRTVEKNGYSIG